jgi:hypothetical protein
MPLIPNWGVVLKVRSLMGKILSPKVRPINPTYAQPVMNVSNSVKGLSMQEI